MSWLSDIGDTLGIGGGGGGDVFNWSSLLPSLISVGGQLAGTYFGLEGQREHDQFMADQALAQQKWAEEQNAKAGSGAGAAIKAAQIAAAAQKEIAKMNQLSALYQNWGQITQRGGESAAQSAQATGKLGQDPIVARLAALR